MDVEDLEVYRRAMDLGDRVWPIVNRWNYFAKDTLGKQLVRSSDSVAANISEGFGRYHYSENKQFCFYARGSLQETRTWLTKAHRRKLLDDGTYETLMTDIDTLAVKLNNYIRSIGRKKAKR